MNHPDPALLVAYLDGTVFHRDSTAIAGHLEICAECTSLLADMREKRAAEQASRTSRSRIMIAAAVGVLAVVGYGVWSLMPHPTSEPAGEQATPVRQALAPDRVETPPPAPAAPAPAAAATAAVASAKPSPPTRRESPRSRVRAVAKPVAKPAAKPATKPAAKPAVPRLMWRTRDSVVESSNDGGATWVAEHTADRTIRASAFLNADVAWVVGDNGLILRRTKNGWFGASAPADGNITAVKASSPSRATVTLEDGRAFSTANGGVTWSPAP